jgi:hypothetical protein
MTPVPGISAARLAGSSGSLAVRDEHRAMHPTIMQALVSQHTTEMRAAAVRRHQAAAQPREPASSIRQRIGWVLVQAGLRLAVR